MSRRISPETLARASSRHPWRTLGAWLVVVVAGVMLSGALLGKALTTDGGFINDPESKQAQQLIEQQLTGPAKAAAVVIVHLWSDPTWETSLADMSAPPTSVMFGQNSVASSFW